MVRISCSKPLNYLFANVVNQEHWHMARVTPVLIADIQAKRAALRFETTFKGAIGDEKEGNAEES